MTDRPTAARYARGLLSACAVMGAASAGSAAAAERTEPFRLMGDAPVAMHSVTDRGALPASARMERVQMALIRPAPLQAELDALTAAQQDPSSPEFHKWLTPTQFTAYSPSAAEVAKVVAWLTANGLTVDEVAPTRMSVAFSGTVAQIARVFGTEIHDVERADGRHHVANMSPPAIPAELSGVIGGVTLSNFFPHPTLRPVGVVRRDGETGRVAVTRPAPGYTTSLSGETIYAVTPQDLATIYDFNPARLGTAGLGLPLTGSGVTVLTAEQTDVNPADWNTFRSAFGLSGYSGTFQVYHPGSCTPPGYTADEGEAALDAEWASAAAPSAAIINVSCAATSTTFGVMSSLQAIVSYGSSAGAVISISYGGCESGNGTSFQSMWNGLVQQAASEGFSVFVSSGDNLVAGCDDDNTATEATTGLAVNGLASTQYDTAVGGTDFSDTADGKNATYWSSTNSASDGSALSYIPEIPWDESCASSVIVKYAGAKDALTYCNTRGNTLLDIVGGSGGKSIVYAKPSWQSTSIPGVPNDGARGLPDVSMFASSGIWSHFLLFCMSDANEGGAPCVYTNANDLQANAAGGTSFAAPIMAGVQALVVQHKGGAKQGNAAPRLYALAQTEFGSSATLNACNSSNGPTTSKSCVFREVTRGDNAALCKKGTANCYSNTESTRKIGVLSTSTTTENDAYPTALGWSFATGLGSVDVTNLLAAY